MTYDFEAHEAASLLQGAYLRQGIARMVTVTDAGKVLVTSPDGWVEIGADFALYSARVYWEAIDALA